MPKKPTIYVTVPEIARAWDVDPKRVYQLLTQGRVPGADCSTGHWRIPADEPKPARKTAGRKAKANG